jgi:hypothetical protein
MYIPSPSVSLTCFSPDGFFTFTSVRAMASPPQRGYRNCYRGIHAKKYPLIPPDAKRPCRTLPDKQKRKGPDFSGPFVVYRTISDYNLVPEVGVEPTRGCPRWILSPVRLPISPLRLKCPGNIAEASFEVKDEIELLNGEKSVDTVEPLLL